MHVIRFITFLSFGYEFFEEIIFKSFDRTFDLRAGRSQLEESFPRHCSREEDSFGTTVLDSQGWIRPVHPFSSSQKRGHFMTVYEDWVVGDRVDAFVEDG